MRPHDFDCHVPPWFNFFTISIYMKHYRQPQSELNTALLNPDAPNEETRLTTKSDDARARAEANFKKEARAKEGAKAMMEYQANSRVVREKTERLKALRLAKEAADKESAGG